MPPWLRKSLDWAFPATVGALRSVWADTGTFFDRQNTLPTAQFSPTPSVNGGNVTVDFSLIDDESDVCQCVVEFAASSDGGNTWTTWMPATMAGAMAGLASSTAGTAYTRTWTSTRDLPGFDGLARLRMRAIDFENGPWHVLPELAGNPQNIVLLNSAVVNAPPQLTVSGTGIENSGANPWKLVPDPGQSLPGIVSIFGTDIDTADEITLTCAFNAAASVGFASVPSEVSATPNFDGTGTATASVFAPNPATVLLFPAGNFAAPAMAVFDLVASDDANGQVTGTLRIHINVAPQIAVPTAPGSPTIAGANRFETALVAGNSLAFSLTASDGNANDTIAFSTTITGGTLSATAAGFDPGSFPASTNSASPAALNFTGTAGGSFALSLINSTPTLLNSTVIAGNGGTGGNAGTGGTGGTGAGFFQQVTYGNPPINYRATGGQGGFGGGGQGGAPTPSSAPTPPPTSPTLAATPSRSPPPAPAAPAPPPAHPMAPPAPPPAHPMAPPAPPPRATGNAISCPIRIHNPHWRPPLASRSGSPILLPRATAQFGRQFPVLAATPSIAFECGRQMFRFPAVQRRVET